MRVRTPATKIQKVTQVLPAADLYETYRLLASHSDNPSSIVLGSTEPKTLLQSRGLWPSHMTGAEFMLYLDTMTYLPDDILTKVDRASMGASLENRVPFLDPEVAALAWRMPFDLKVRDGTGKWLLRQLLYRYVPQSIVDRPKMGFGIPLGAWLRDPLRDWAEDLLSPDRLRREGYLAPDYVARIWDEHQSGRCDREYELWDVLMFQAWMADH
jgi:asparagine synthase (glutamine-hydrolysing)